MSKFDIIYFISFFTEDIIKALKEKKRKKIIINQWIMDFRCLR